MKYRRGYEPEPVTMDEWKPKPGQRDFRIRDAKAANKQQQKDKKNPSLPQDMVERNGTIRTRELGKQKADMGGTPDSIRRIQ